jgi:hypothetical protein
MSPLSLSELEKAVLLRLGARVRDFRLAIENGKLVLRGRARTYYVKQLVQHAVMETSKLLIQANHIEVE